MFGGSWGQNNQQQQQQPQQQGGFGFGGQQQQQQQPNTGFGQPQAATGFGQPAQQQNTGGLFGGGAQNTGFGAPAQNNTNNNFAFGGNNQAQQSNAFGGGARPGFGATGGSTFGQPVNNTGGGLFGGAASTSTFGAANNSTFGKPATSTFGSGQTSGLFGAPQQQQNTGFGGGGLSDPNSWDANAVHDFQGNHPPEPPQNGTAHPLYQPTWHRDPPPLTGRPTPAAILPHLYHSINAMYPYRGASTDELRFMDYEQNRKVAGAAPVAGGFGQTAAGGFGQPQQQQAGGFGQPQANNSPFGAKPGGLFGAPAPAATGFGGSTSGGLFGQNNTNTNTGGGMFGQAQQQPQQTGGLFGAAAQPQQQTGGLFGQPAQQQQQPAGGLFNNANPFGQPQQQAQPAAGGFSFGGANATKPAFGAVPATNTFGQTNNATTGFGQPAQPANTGFAFGGGQQQQQQQPAAGGGLFGGGGFGANAAQPASTGLFGQNNQQQQQPAQTGGLFGAAAAKPAGGLFGATAAAPATGGFNFGGNNQQQQQQQQPANTGLFGAPAANTGGLFGQNNQQQQTQVPAAGGGLFGGQNTASGGLFGAKPATTGGLSGGLFGAQPAQNAALANNMFGGGAPAGGGLFGSNNNNTLGQSQQNNGLNKPAGGLFGGGSLFGQPNQQQQQQQPAAGGLFGGQSTNTGGGLFGSVNQTTAQPSGLGGNMFGSQLGLGQSQNQQQQQQQQQPSLTASIDQNPYGNNPLFAYNGQTLDLGSSSKKPALPPLTSSTFRLTPNRKTQVNKLRGFASPAPSPRAGSPLNGLTSSSSGRTIIGSPVGSDRYQGLSDTVLPPNAFVPRPSIKRLTVTPKSNGKYGNEDHLESVLGKSALKSSGSTPAAPARQAQAPAVAQSAGTLLFNPTAADKGKAANNAGPSRSAVVNKQPKEDEYWCRPKLEKLKQLSENDLREISNFSAGRRGHGEMVFLQPVDLTDLDLDTFLGTVITFGDRDISLYGDFSPLPKAAPGTGLNVPAQVTLENIYPQDKETDQPVTDVEDARLKIFIKRIKAKSQTEFVSHVDGAWTFKVDHFSRYGIDPEDEREESDGEASAGNVKAAEARKEREHRSPSEDEDEVMPPTKSRHDHEESDHDSGFEEEESGEEEEESEGDGTELSSQSDEHDQGQQHEEGPWAQPMLQKLGSEGSKKVAEMQMGFFAPLVKRAVVAGRLPQKRRADVEGHEQDFKVAGEGSNALDDRAVKRASFGAGRPAKLRQARAYAKVPLEKSVVKGNEGVRVDAGLAWGRSGAAVWGFGGEIVHLGKICGPAADFASGPEATVTIEKVNLLAETHAVEAARADRLLRLHLDRSQITLIDNIPTASIDSTIRFADFARLFDAGDRSLEASIFRLGVALFDEIDLNLPIGSSEDLTSRVMEVRRKLALSRWLQHTVSPAVDAELVKTNSQPAKLFSLLSGNQVERAVDAAIEGNDMRLATLLAQIGSGDAFRAEIHRQLADWKKYKASPLISVEYRRIYALLAGITDVLPGDSSRGVDGCADVIISKDLDWKRAFGVQMWFGNHFEDTIPTILESFSTALTAPYAPTTPLPPYLEKPYTLEQSWKMSSQPTDILFGLIRLYSDSTISLDQVLRSRDASPSPFDMRVIWHLYILLSQVLRQRDFEDRDIVDGYSASADKITVGYAGQLEGMGDWVGAAFVLMHLETPHGRESSIRALLHRHPTPTADEHRRLTEVLHVPIEWLHESKATLLASNGDAYGEYQELLKANQSDMAHKILVGKLLPEIILRDDLVLIKKLCGEVEGRVEGWEYGAKLFLEYVHICQDVPRLLTSVLRDRSSSTPADKTRLAELAQAVPRLIKLLPALFPNRGDVQQVAGLADMLSNLHHLAGSLYAAGYIARPAVSPLMVDVDRLHLLQAASMDSFAKSLEACAA